MPKKVLLETPWTLHAAQRQLLEAPPEGYEFVAAGGPSARWLAVIAGWGPARAILQGVDAVIPSTLAKSWLERRKTLPADIVLTYAVDHPVFRPEPWVVEVEYACALLGSHASHLLRFRHVAQAALAGLRCRRILCWSEAGRASLADLGSNAFAHKIEVVYAGIAPVPFVKRYRDSVKLLFIGSGVSVGAFEGRGNGVFETFAVLRERYPNLELVVRSDVPPYLRRRFAGMPGVRIMDRVISRAAVEHELETADIFFIPSYHTLPFTLLDAMRYELPIVTIDSWANREYVEDGRTGFVASRSRMVPTFLAGTRQPNFLDSSFRQRVRAPDREQVTSMATAVARLVEQPELRRRLGKAGRWEVEHGKFSLSRMKAALKRIYDEATDESGVAAGV